MQGTNFCLRNPCPLQPMHHHVLIMNSQINLIQEKTNCESSLEKKNYFQELKNKIIEIENEADSSLLLNYDAERIMMDSKQKLKQIEKKSWPFQFLNLSKSLFHLNEKVKVLCKEFCQVITVSEDTILSDYQSLLNKKMELLEDELYQTLEISKINQIFCKQRKEIKTTCKYVEDFCSVITTKNKIAERIDEISKILDIEEEKNELFSIMNDFNQKFYVLNTDEEKDELVENVLHKIHKIHTEIEKKITQKEIYEIYEQFTGKVNKFVDPKLKISSELNYVSDVLEDSGQIINNIAKHPSPFGLNPISQLEITKEGLQRTINYALKSIYVKIGRQEIEKLIDQLPFSNKLDLRMLTEIKDHAKEELSDECCPILSEKDKKVCIHNLCKNIYLIYAEMCIRKTLKFILLIQRFENSSENNKKALIDKTEKIIFNMRKKIEHLFENKNVHDEFGLTHNHTSGFDITIDNIISECNIELRS